MARLNRYALRLTNGRMDALGVVLFVVCAAFLIGLLVEIFRGYP